MSKLVKDMTAQEKQKEKQRNKLRRQNATEDQKQRQRDASKAWANSPKGQQWQRNKEASESTQNTRSEWRKNNKDKLKAGSWKALGIKGITIEMWERDSRKGCMFSSLGNCAGRLGAHHNHDTGVYVGPLCLIHNTHLSSLGDTRQNLLRVSELIRRRP